MRLYRIFAISMGLLFGFTQTTIPQDVSWHSFALGGYSISALAVGPGGYIYAGTSKDIYRSSDYGGTWGRVYQGGSSYSGGINSIDVDVSSSYVYATFFGLGILVSSDHGSTWSETSAYQPTVMAVTPNGDAYYGSYWDGVYRSSDKGKTWAVVNSGLGNTQVTSMSVSSSGQIFAGTLGGLFQSTDKGLSWWQINNQISVGSVGVNVNGHIYIGDGSYFAKVYRSTNNGASWLKVKDSIYTYAQCFAFNQCGRVFLGTEGGGGSKGVLTSTNNGDSWSSSNAGFADSSIWVLSVTSDGYVLAGTQKGIYETTGPTTPPRPSVLTGSALQITSMSAEVSGTVDPNGTDADSYFQYGSTTAYGNATITTDIGSGVVPVPASAILVNLSPGTLYHYQVVGSNCAGLSFGVDSTFLTIPSAPGLVSPEDTSSNVPVSPTLAWNASDGTTAYHLQVSTYSSFTQDLVKDSILNATTCMLGPLQNGSTCYWHVAARNKSGTSPWSATWQFRTSITGVYDWHPLPVEYKLDQNYPNPFNPSTTIQYSLPSKSHVALTVSNTLGQLVTTLVNGDQEPGYHEVKFDGSNLASGVYFYRLQAGTFVETRKLLLLR